VIHYRLAHRRTPSPRRSSSGSSRLALGRTPWRARILRSGHAGRYVDAPVIGMGPWEGGMPNEASIRPLQELRAERLTWPVGHPNRGGA